MRKKLTLFCISAALTPLLYSQTPVVNAKERTATFTLNGNPNEAAWEFTNTVTKPIMSQ